MVLNIIIKNRRKFNKVAKDLKKVSKIPAWFRYR